MNAIERCAYKVVQSCEGSPITSTVVVILFWAMFNVLEGAAEKLIFGERFEHFLDLIFGAAFIAFAALCVFMCAVFNSEKLRK